MRKRNTALSASDSVSTTGGEAYAVLNVDLAQGVAVTSQTAVIRLLEEPDTAHQMTHPFAANHVDVPVNLAATLAEDDPNYHGRWQRFFDPDEAGGPQHEGWWDVPEGPAAPVDADAPASYRYLLLWHTKVPMSGTSATTDAGGLPITVPTSLLGHNGLHTVSLLSVDGTVDAGLGFSDGTTPGTMKVGGTDTNATVSATIVNLVVDGVSCSDGTIDYFKWDPNNPNAGYDHPVIRFSIDDLDESHAYKWTLWYKPTSDIHRTDAPDWTAEADKIEGIATSVGDIKVDLANPDVIGHLDPDINIRGPYTYDIRVVEFKNEAAVRDDECGALDSAQFKQPYVLWVPSTYTENGVTAPAHDVWLNIPDDTSGDYELRCNYYLYPNPALNGIPARSAAMTVLDPGLNERRTLAGPTELGVLQGGEDGIVIYRIAPGEPEGDWRVVFTGEHGISQAMRRDHTFARTIPVNKKKRSLTMIPFTTNDDNNVPDNWYALWIYTARAHLSTRYFDVNQADHSVAQWLDIISGPVSKRPTDVSPETNEWAVLNGGYYGGHESWHDRSARWQQSTLRISRENEHDFAPNSNTISRRTRTRFRTELEQHFASNLNTISRT